MKGLQTGRRLSFLSSITVLNLNGGPSKMATVLSSLPLTNRNGLVGLKSMLLIGLD